MLSDAINFIPHPSVPNTILPPFSCVDGLGDSVAKSIVEARKNGPFISKEDLMRRTSINQTNLKKLEDLQSLNDLDDTNQMSLF